MKLIQHSTAATFLAHAQTALERQEAFNNLMLGIVLRLHEYPDQIKALPYLATVEEDDELLVAAVMTPPFRLIIHAESADPAPLRLIACDLQAHGWTHVPLRRYGPPRWAAPFASCAASASTSCAG